MILIRYVATSENFILFFSSMPAVSCTCLLISLHHALYGVRQLMHRAKEFNLINQLMSLNRFSIWRINCQYAFHVQVYFNITKNLTSTSMICCHYNNIVQIALMSQECRKFTLVMLCILVSGLHLVYKGEPHSWVHHLSSLERYVECISYLCVHGSDYSLNHNLRSTACIVHLAYIRL